jgi:hypothetical protein
MMLDGTILNADINASAAIAGSKIVAATTGKQLLARYSLAIALALPAQQ